MLYSIYRFERIIKIFVLVALIVAATYVFLPMNQASADNKIIDTLGKAGKGMDATSDNEGTPKNDFPTLIGNVVKVLLGILGVIFLILMIYAGIKWMTAYGEADDVQKAKDTMRQAITGLAITLAAYAITYFVVDKLTAATIGNK